jgi:hypothetical protein
MVVAWTLGTYAFLYFFPHIFYNTLKKAIVRHGIDPTASAGVSPGIPINTLYAMPALASPTTVRSKFVEGANHDTLYTVGWLDLSREPEILQVPEMAGRYYSIEFIDGWGNAFAYVGRRTTGTRAGSYLICGPGWHGAVSAGLTPIVSPNNSVLLLGRVLVKSDSDLPAAYGLEKQIKLRPLSEGRFGQ